MTSQFLASRFYTILGYLGCRVVRDVSPVRPVLLLAEFLDHPDECILCETTFFFFPATPNIPVTSWKPHGLGGSRLGSVTIPWQPFVESKHATSFVNGGGMAEMRDGGILSRIRQLLGAQTWKEPIRSWYNDRIDGIPTTDKVHHGSPSPG